MTPSSCRRICRLPLCLSAWGSRVEEKFTLVFRFAARERGRVVVGCLFESRSARRRAAYLLREGMVSGGNCHLFLLVLFTRVGYDCVDSTMKATIRAS